MLCSKRVWAAIGRVCAFLAGIRHEVRHVFMVGDIGGCRALGGDKCLYGDFAGHWFAGFQT